MLCIKKQFGTIFAIATPALVCASGFWKYSHFMDDKFVMTGSWLACLIGFVAVLMVTGAQRRHGFAAHFVLLGSMAVALLAAFLAIQLREIAMLPDAGSVVWGGWRAGAVVAMTGMVVSIFAATQIAWRYANANHPDQLAACTGFFKFGTLR